MPKKNKSSPELTRADFSLINGYQDGSLAGWVGEKEKALFNDTKQEYQARGLIYPFRITRQEGASEPYQRPEYFSLHRVARAVLKKDIGGNVQEIGDCFIAGTPVRMADGSEKAIEKVRVGERVLTHEGNCRPVTDRIAKKYSGELVHLKTQNAPVVATADHRFYSCRGTAGGEWTPISKLPPSKGILHFSSGERKWAKSNDPFPREKVKDTNVYCLEVEKDHSFVAGGYACHNCVSFGGKHSSEYVSVCNILVRKKSEKFRHIYAPYYYGTGRVYVGKGRLWGDGSLGSWMAEGVKLYGTLFMDEEGVPKYSGAVARAWGDNNPSNDLDKWKAKASPYKIKAPGMVTTWDQLCDALANGYAVSVCSNQGFEMTPGNDGYHDASGTWNHCMNIFAYGPDYALIANSWGDVHGKLKDFHSDDTLPVGTIRARKKVVERMLSQEDSFAYVDGDFYPEQNLAKELFYLLAA